MQLKGIVEPLWEIWSRLLIFSRVIKTFLHVCVGFYQCGPASVNAIKNGEVYLNYDTGFIFAEVNADKVYWEVPFLFSGEMRAIQTDKMVIGKNISTLKPSTNGERQDITRRYKHPEGILSNMQGWP